MGSAAGCAGRTEKRLSGESDSGQRQSRTALESTLRRILREELQAVPSQPVQQPEEAIPPEMLGFLNTLMDDG